MGCQGYCFQGRRPCAHQCQPHNEVSALDVATALAITVALIAAAAAVVWVLT